MTEQLLTLDGVYAGYDGNTVLRNVSLEVDEGSVTSIIGRNGAGKTTTLRAVMGHIPVSKGIICFREKDITNQTPELIYRTGIGLVPEHREIFPGLTVEENLKMGATSTDSGWFTLEEAYEFFPRLRERRLLVSKQLSGGEQQMLAIARSLMGDTELLLLDEPTEGLAPQIVEKIINIIDRLSDDGLTVLIVEQNLKAVMRVANYHYVLTSGSVVFEGSSEDLNEADEVRQRHLSVT
jgi:branched-chain amino acid transport system ATP-binding protein